MNNHSSGSVMNSLLLLESIYITSMSSCPVGGYLKETLDINPHSGRHAFVCMRVVDVRGHYVNLAASKSGTPGKHFFTLEYSDVAVQLGVADLNLMHDMSDVYMCR
jgi:hypothetical protein